MRTIVCLCVFVLSTALSGAAFSGAQIKQYVNTQYGFRFSYPASWVSVEGGVEGTQVMLVSGEETGASCSVVVAEFAQLRGLSRLQLDQLLQKSSFNREYWLLEHKNFTNVLIEEMGVTQLLTSKGQYVLSSFEHNLMGKIKHIKSYTVVTYANGASIVLICSAHEKYFDSAKPVLLMVIGTFILD